MTYFIIEYSSSYLIVGIDKENYDFPIFALLTTTTKQAFAESTNLNAFILL